MERQLLIELRKPIFEDYLRWVFSAKQSGPIYINRKNIIGKHIWSQFDISDNPVPIEFKSSPVSLILPVDLFKASSNHFLYFKPFKQEQVNDYIESMFDIDFMEFVQKGVEKGIQRKYLYESFLKTKNISPRSDLFERIKKKDYRNRKRMESYLQEGLKSIGFCQ